MTSLMPRWMSPLRLFSNKSHFSKFRNPFEHDLGILLHSSVFRRLSHKTQVYINPDNDFVRSRLTHSLECQQIGRELARRFSYLLFKFQKIDAGLYPLFTTQLESLVAAACIAHDMGHPPFGHTGADLLNEVCLESGIDFDDNKQTLRHFFREDRPLNITVALADAVLKYKNPACFPEKAPAWYACDTDKVKFVTTQTGTGLHRHPACYLMEIADDISYLCGDLEDALKYKRITWDQAFQLLAKLPHPTFSKEADDFVLSSNTFKDVFFSQDLPSDPSNIFQSLCSSLLKLMMLHAHNTLSEFLNHKTFTLDELPMALASTSFSNGILYADSLLGKEFLNLKKHFYNDLLLNHTDIVEERKAIAHIIHGLWFEFKKIAACKDWQELENVKSFQHLPSQQKHYIRNCFTSPDGPDRSERIYRFCADYLSGMTDRFAIKTLQALHTN